MTIRGDVVGSLLRPAYLVEARTAREAGRLAPAEFKRVEDRAVDEAVALQEAAGLDVVSDGELRRYAFFGHLVDAVDGFDKFGGWAIPFRDEEGGELIFKRPVVVEKLRWRRSMCAEEFVYLRARVRRPETLDGQDQLTATGRQGSRPSRSMVPKATLISTQQAAAYYDPQRSAGAYPTRDAYLADVVDLTRREIDELVRLGCTYIQVDAPQYAALLDPTMREGYRKRGSDPDALIDACIEMDNAVIGHHPGVIFGLHICRGNNQSKFYASGDYGPIARVFGKSRFHRFLLEYDDDRSGGGRAARRDAAGSRGRPRARHDEEATARERGRATTTHRRSEPVRSARASRREPAVRLCVDDGRQPDIPRAPAREARARGRDRPARMGNVIGGTR
jgi:5-methyltetrahydropteroyltriglutamate--homocysteine methyltransferase